ncbi:MAG: ribosomal RNA small subunit methyltransferase A [Clostridia bacterium]|nr:ribosomal RNA small subunit methyltransferase A [Clostridia bacterium]
MEKFVFKKKFGQNFLKDDKLLEDIVADAKVTMEDNILEIGTGAGALTEKLISKAKRVVSVEIDKELQPILLSKFAGQKNLKLIFGDILRIGPDELLSFFEGEKFKVVANLPYYISTPILFWLVKSGFNLSSVTVMLQKELAERICSTENDSEYGGISVILGVWSKLKLTRIVPKNMFIPMPEVDSAVVNMEVNYPQYLKLDKLMRVVKSSFAMRRKTLVNNLMKGFGINRGQAEQLLDRLGVAKDIRAEKLSKEQYKKLVDLIENDKLL